MAAESPWIGELRRGMKLLVSVHEVERGTGAKFKAVARLKDGFLHRLDLGRPLGPFYAGQRLLRPQQPLVVVIGSPVRADSEALGWERLWPTPPM